MKRIIITGAVLLGTVSASLGLIANASFAQSAPSVVPVHATVLDDKGGLSAHVEAGDDKSAPSVVPVHATVLDDKGGLSAHVEAGDDKSALSPQVEAGDDKGGLSTQVEAGDDNGSHGGKDDGPGHS